MRINVLAGVLFALLPLISGAATPAKEANLGARADDDFVNTSDSVSLASNDGNITPAGSGGERRACPGGYGYCPNFPDICCPLGGKCCSNRRCCGPGYYCVLTFSGIRCCPNAASVAHKWPTGRAYST
ncbi:hypothetical protein B0J17DRAFT_717027 [Rhizoctonia solani]|nr:hypothetical protein B0J17DRAFT_717027 [Rhizoctonia solani]